VHGAALRRLTVCSRGNFRLQGNRERNERIIARAGHAEGRENHFLRQNVDRRLQNAFEDYAEQNIAQIAVGVLRPRFRVERSAHYRRQGRRCFIDCFPGWQSARMRNKLKQRQFADRCIQRFRQMNLHELLQMHTTIFDTVQQERRRNRFRYRRHVENRIDHRWLRLLDIRLRMPKRTVSCDSAVPQYRIHGCCVEPILDSTRDQSVGATQTLRIESQIFRHIEQVDERFH